MNPILDWLLERIGLVIFVLVFVAQILRGLARARRNEPEEAARPDALEEDRRVREIQEDIRRRIAERRGETLGEPPVQARREEPSSAPAPGMETTRMPEPFGGPMRRLFEEMERRAKPEPVAPPPVADVSAAELERQRRLAEEIKELEAAREEAWRRASQAAAAKEVASHGGAASAVPTAAFSRDDLRDPKNLRRAVILREVLGTPVGLR